MTTSRGEPMALARLRQHPAFLRFWGASTLSDFGTAITSLALSVLVVNDLGGSATEVGAVNAARWAAYLVLGLVAGMWIDRVRRRPVLVATDLGRGVLLGLICTLALTDRLGIGLLVVLIAGFGLLSLLNDAANQSFLTSLVPRPLLTRANARLEQSAAVAQTTGPALAGLLIRLLSAPVAILVDAVTYLVGAAMVASLPDLEPRTQGRPPRGSARAEIAEGLRWVYRHTYLAPMALNSHLWFLCWAILNTVLVTYALTELGLTALSLGVCLAVGGVGALVGTSLCERATTRFGPGRVMFISRFGYPPAVVIVALVPAADRSGEARWSTLILCAVSQLIIGLAMGLEGPVEMSFRQEITADRLQGRMNTTIRSINRAMVVIGAPLGGLLADHAGFRTALWVSAAGFVVGIFTFGFSRMRNARVEDAHW
ncbi:MAG: MFS transporter [Propionibacteriaceae bacterium]